MLNKKRKGLFLLIICICVIIAVSACSGGGASSGGAAEQKSGTQDNLSAQNNTGNEKTSGTASGSSSDSGTAAGEDKGVKLPDNYPLDIFPVYPGSFLQDAAELGGMFNIIAYSKDDYDKVLAFYKELFKNGTLTSEIDSPDTYTAYGSIGKYSYNMIILTSDKPEYSSNFIFTLTPAQ